ncbi:MAG: alpha/beta hydrolase [Beijerinckiaceae bacterium]|nr:alpha/beta hydrolase [Beijerinckiaceae bacterium]
MLAAPAARADERTHYRTAEVGGVKVFYREAGQKGAPKVLLLHGWGASSFMFRNLIPELAKTYHVVAPDLPGFGLTEAPPRGSFKYDFDHLADVIDSFTEAKGFDRYAVYIFDYGAPTGLRLALRHPERITAIISQNGNAYEEGLSTGWTPIRKYWSDPSDENRNALRGFMTLQTNKWQYEEGVPDKSLIEPEAYLSSQAGFDKPGNLDIQLDLFGDYKSNVALYPKFQAYFRERKPPLLAVWGKNDPFFLPAGAEAFKRDNPNAEVRFFDTGHFALETHNAEIAAAIMAFLGKLPR